MHKPTWLQANMSLGNILSIGVMLAAVVSTWTLTSYRLDAMEAFRKERTVETDKKFADLNGKVAEIPQLAYRVTRVEAALEQINQRIDAGFSTFSARLDRNGEATSEGMQSIQAAIAALDTRVAVLTQRLEGMPNGRRAELRNQLTLPQLPE